MSFMSDDETNDILEEYIAKKKVSKSVAIRTGIHKLKDELK
ncbi:CopG family transcriptional regulator [Lactococcus cremoris]|nr:CopG family transcriptional regulator [Lactococcus lactis subsp. lactis KLDS 4.0325]MCT0456737.1 CopG family transcriptional regulator [Lactococcus cremoris]MCT3120456.1 CopG family transcriptional regulator [Lactococcus lactis]MCT0474507.1 CopG family transcriptional regulator [Lactococcus cremoris]MCT0511537.1 CopG family transcriptional regulator [Lactococcus cremoris]